MPQVAGRSPQEVLGVAAVHLVDDDVADDLPELGGGQGGVLVLLDLVPGGS